LCRDRLITGRLTGRVAAIGRPGAANVAARAGATPRYGSNGGDGVDDVDDERDDRPPDGQDGPDEQPTRPGRMRFQDETTTPREPTLAERRAREVAARRAAEADRQRLAEVDLARRKRKRILVGAGVTVGVVALIAIGYAVAQPDEEVVAHCVDENNVVVDDANCATPAASGGYYGGAFIPIFIGAGGRQYHYNYGGAGTVGTTVSGGTTTVPRDSTRVTTSSGKTISRGGLGVGSGSSGGSSSSSGYGGKSSGS
jgi:hypothetical protein